MAKKSHSECYGFLILQLEFTTSHGRRSEGNAGEDLSPLKWDRKPK